MIVIHPQDQEGVAGNRRSRVTGTAFPYVTKPAGDGPVLNTVNFTPGAHTFWHAHEHGQILQILAGRGLVQSEGGPVEVVRAGDTVWCPPGEKHWHGAAPDSYMVHTAISLGTTSWADAVDDADYQDPEARKE